MQLTYLHLFELCFTDLIEAVCLSTETKQNKLSCPVGQLSVWPRCFRSVANAPGKLVTGDPDLKR